MACYYRTATTTTTTTTDETMSLAMSARGIPALTAARLGAALISLSIYWQLEPVLLLQPFFCFDRLDWTD